MVQVAGIALSILGSREGALSEAACFLAGYLTYGTTRLAMCSLSLLPLSAASASERKRFVFKIRTKSGGIVGNIAIEAKYKLRTGRPLERRSACRFRLSAIHRCNSSSTPAAMASRDRIWLA